MSGLLKEKTFKTHKLPNECWERFSSLFTTETYDANSTFLRIGDIGEDMFFLVSGLVRAYSLSPKGKEINSLIFAKGNYVGDFSSLIKNCPTNMQLQALTDVEIMRCNFNKFRELTDISIDVNTMYRKFLEKFYLSLEQRDKELVYLNSTERFLQLKKRIPKIEMLISQKHIASHLGITSVQLSRLKKDLLSS